MNSSILVVDDEKDIADLLEIYLKNERVGFPTLLVLKLLLLQICEEKLSQLVVWGFYTNN